MINAQNMKIVDIGFGEALIDDASLTTAVIDLKGWDYAQVYVRVGTTDIAMAACKIQDSSTSGGSYTDVTGLIWGTSDNIAGATSTLPSATDDGTYFVFDIDCRKVDRFIDLVATNGNGTAGGFLSAFVILSRGESSPITAADRGVTEALRI